MQHRDMGIGEGKRGKYRGKVYLRKTETLSWRILRREGKAIYEKCTVHKPCLVPNKGQMWKTTRVVIGWEQSQSVTMKPCG